jgi:hypothetical protein
MVKRGPSDWPWNCDKQSSRLMLSVTEPMPLVMVTASFAFATGEVINEGFSNPQRPHGVDVENCRPGFIIDIAGSLTGLAHNACAVDRDLDGHVTNRPPRACEKRVRPGKLSWSEGDRQPPQPS